MKNRIKKTIENIFNINLKVKKTEKVIIFTDSHSRAPENITRLITKIGERFSKKIKYIKYQATDNHGVEPPEVLWLEAFGEKVLTKLKQKKLFKPLIAKEITPKQLKETEKIVKKFKKDAVNVVIALSYYSTTHTSFRNLLTRICGARYASIPLFEESMLKEVMSINWKEMSRRTNNIAHRVNKSESIELKTSNGTFLIFSKSGRQAKTDTGIITKKGTVSNLPAGEVFLAPVEGTAEGRLVLEWAPTRKFKNPLILHVKNGMVSKIEGKERYADYLKAKFSERTENANIAEFGIGTNDRASRPDNILEAEKIFGTIHIALGDNSSFGGKVRTPFHQDFVFFKPTLTLIHKNGRREILLKNGKLFV